MELPHRLQLKIERELRGNAGLVREASLLSASYRAAGRPDRPLTHAAAMAYAATRMPATYAAVSAALRALAVAMPTFAPTSQLDAGAGTGAALWAASERWPSLRSATLLERELAMIALGQRLAEGSNGVTGGAYWLQADVLGPWSAPAHGLVTAAYMLGELAEGARATLVARLWECTEEALLLVEPGTPRGWSAIRAAREQLRGLGARIVAPCPHQGDCPMPEDDWCHFAQRVARSRAHRAVKGALLGYEDEKFSYLAVAHAPGQAVAARVLRHPLVRPGRVELTLCADVGIHRSTVSRGAGEAWHRARELRWGDSLPPDALEEA
jgi:ribosomal protein RSM22 (predicted rRNA methylase)